MSVDRAELARDLLASALRLTSYETDEERRTTLLAAAQVQATLDLGTQTARLAEEQRTANMFRAYDLANRRSKAGILPAILERVGMYGGLS